MDNVIELGYISGFFGVKGWVKIFSHTRPRLGISQYLRFYLGTAAETASAEVVTFTTIKSSGKYIIGHIQNVTTREAASPYLGKHLFIKQDDLPTLDNEYYWHQLIGLTVVNRHNQILGKITDMMETGANDVMVIHDKQGNELLIPYALSHFVLAVDIAQGQIHVDWEIDDDDS